MLFSVFETWLLGIKQNNSIFYKKKLILYFKKLSLRSEKRGIFDKPK